MARKSDKKRGAAAAKKKAPAKAKSPAGRRSAAPNRKAPKPAATKQPRVAAAKRAAPAPRLDEAASEPSLHLIKLCVGVADIAELADWQKKRRAQFKRRFNVHVTRSFPRRAEELLDGGSLYWVIAGRIRVRQRLIGIVEHREGEGEPRCALQLAPQLIEVEPRHHRPFQGWRYLAAKDAPPDLRDGGAAGDTLPPAMLAELRELGLL